MKKMIIILLLYSTVLITTYAEGDSTNDHGTKLKGVELSVGIGFSHSFIGVVSYQKVFDYNDMNKMIDEYFEPLVPRGQSLMLSVPFSILYYPNKFFGIGITGSIGINLCLIGFPMIYPNNLDVVNELKIINKVGNISKRKFFVLEYGLKTSGKFFFGYYVDHAHQNWNFFLDNSNKPGDFNVYTQFYLGPSLLLGFEVNTNKKFAFLFGGIFDVEFKDERDINYGYDDSGWFTYYYKESVTEYLEGIINIGIECRWRFGYLKVL